MHKILFVVHRYAPYPGGSEYNVQRYAEAALALGHDVTVLAGTHLGDYNGIKVTSNIGVLKDKWDLIIVHGWASTQQAVYLTELTDYITSPIYHLIIRAENGAIPALLKADYVGCATSEDTELFLRIANNLTLDFRNKYRQINYAIPPYSTTLQPSAIRDKFEIVKPKVWMSAGGFAPHKGMRELQKAYIENGAEDVQLVLIGYDTGHGIPMETLPSNFNGKISYWEVDNQNDIYDLMSIADLYIWNSVPTSEGYGLVLLESMMMECPWIGRNMVAARDLAAKEFGVTYDTYEELMSILRNPPSRSYSKLMNSKEYVLENHNPLTVTKNLLSVLPND